MHLAMFGIILLSLSEKNFKRKHTNINGLTLQLGREEHEHLFLFHTDDLNH